jgi:AcrR family transcriptional regulator
MGGTMPRIVKTPEVRKDEIIETAKKLFFQKGFHNTSVQDIVKQLHIAQGTFYYHFESKMDVLDKMTDKVRDTIIDKLKTITGEHIDAVSKINKLFAHTASLKIANRDTIIILLRVLLKDENVLIRQKMNEKTIRGAAPLYAKVIKQGIGEGVFDTPHPDVVGEILMEIIINANEAISRLIIRDLDKKEKLSRINKRMIMFAHTVEKLLGAQTGVFQGFDSGQVKNFLRKKNREGDI